MKRSIAAVLLVLSLGALAAGRLSGAVADDHVDTIRLPSNGLADEVATEIGAEKKRPWKCCDSPLCSRSIPPRCRCTDAVEQCDEACTRCEASQSDPSKRICNDQYHGWPGPNCTKPDGDNVPNGPGVSGHQETVAVAITEEARPWRCCNRPLCTRSVPPTCRFLDSVDRCAPTCKRCVVSIFDPTDHSCDDQYHGDPGPRCTRPDRNGDISSSVAGRPHAAAAVETVVSNQKSIFDGEEKARPWKCWDDTICTMSFPPTCFCRDRVKKCAKTCKKCDKDESDASRHVCGDSYFGWPGPRCTKPDAGDVPSGPGVSGPPVVGHEATAAATMETVVSEEKSVVDGEKARPWKCCDQTLCTRSAPPTCFCHDKVKRCAKTCKNCLKDEEGSSLHMCGDPYFGWPGPRCHEI